MNRFGVLLNFDNDSRSSIVIKEHTKLHAISHLQTNKWVKDEELEIYYNMDKVLNFQIYNEE